MKKNYMYLSLLFLIVLLTAGSIRGQTKFSVRMTAGYTQVSIGDLNSVIASHDMIFEDISTALGLAKTGSLEKITGGLDLGGELVLDLTPKFGIGLGLGFLKCQKNSSTALSLETLFQLETSLKLKPMAFPVRVNVYYRFPVITVLDFYLTGGIGYYFGKMTYLMQMDESIMDFSSSTQADGNVQDQGIGYHGGLGLEFNTAHNVTIFLEAEGRYVKLSDWKGSEMYSDSEGTRESRSGTLWFYETSDPELLKNYSDLILSETRPEGPHYQNARKFNMDFSGMSLKAGVRIIF